MGDDGSSEFHTFTFLSAFLYWQLLDNWTGILFWFSNCSGIVGLPALWLATRAGKKEPYNKSFIDQTCSVKMAWYWPCSFFLRVYGPQLRLGPWNGQKKNLANIWPSWPHTWSMTHTWRAFYDIRFSLIFFKVKRMKTVQMFFEDCVAPS